MTDEIRRAAELIAEESAKFAGYEPEARMRGSFVGYVYHLIFQALLAERRKAYEDAIEAIKAMKYDPHCAHEQYCYCSEGLISQREAEIEIRRRMEGV